MTNQSTVSFHQEIWQKAKSELSNLVSADIFESWFANLACLDGDDDSLKLGAKGPFATLWISENYLDILSTQVSLAAGRKLNVIIETLEDDNNVQNSAPVEQVAPVRQRVIVNTEQELPKSINPRNTFENFVVGESNNYAHAAALAVAQNPGVAYNPLFIYGATGLGKTHLMHAIAQFVLKNRRDARIVYLSSEAFINEYVDALRAGNISAFRKRYRNTDVLLIDDVQFFARKERCQEEFFHTFNELFNSGKQIVLSCDKPVNEVPDIEARLVSRFGWGVSVDIQAPDYETRLAILRKKVNEVSDTISIQPEVIDLLARRFTKNVRRMEGALNNLIGYATTLNQPISLEKAQSLLSDALMLEDNNQVVDIDQIQKQTAQYYNIDVAELKGKRRPANIALARQVAMYIARKLTTHSLQEIGKYFGRDHGTVMHAIRVVDHAINHDEKIKHSVEYLLKTLSL